MPLDCIGFGDWVGGGGVVILYMMDSYFVGKNNIYTANNPFSAVLFGRV